MNELNSALNDTEHMNVPTASRVPRVLIVTAVDAEKEAILRGLGDKVADMFDVIAAGVGPASAAAGTAAALALAAASASRLKAPAVATAPDLATAPPSDAAAVDPALAQGATAPEQPDAAQASAASTTPGCLPEPDLSVHAGGQCRHRRRLPRRGGRRLPRGSRRHGCCRSGLASARRLPLCGRARIRLVPGCGGRSACRPPA